MNIHKVVSVFYLFPIHLTSF